MSCSRPKAGYTKQCHVPERVCRPRPVVCGQRTNLLQRREPLCHSVKVKFLVARNGKTRTFSVCGGDHARGGGDFDGRQLLTDGRKCFETIQVCDVDVVRDLDVGGTS